MSILNADMASNNPLLAARPPATDYISYLTVIEYNLTPELLPTLHEILQDTPLTENIGWDLVHLLLPLLPASGECLQDIARLGNPREVIIKVTEGLYTAEEIDNDGNSATPAIDSADLRQGIDDASDNALQSHPLDKGLLRVQTLTAMLSILHARIKTKFPSRFLSGSLQAVLAAVARSTSPPESLVEACIKLVKTLANTHRGQWPPQLPPRTVSASSTQQAQAADPEAENNTDTRSTDDADIQRRLLQSFVTHLVEVYVTSLSSHEDIPGLAWSGRMRERVYPEWTVSGKTRLADKFASESALRARVKTAGDIVRLAASLGITDQELLQTASTSDFVHPAAHDTFEDEPPKSAADIPLSRHGALMLLAARVFDGQSNESTLQIWPHNASILQSAARNFGEVHSDIGSEPEVVLDAILTLALHSVVNDEIGQPRDATDFNKFLQAMSLIASNCPSPSLRFQAYYLTTTILRSNPSDVERLGFIHDTLEHCPFDNLKVAAVSWMKGEIIEANPPSAPQPMTGATVFSTPIALDTLGPFLFPDLTQELASADVVERWEVFDQQSPFYLAVLNFYFLLLTAKHLWLPLALPTLHTSNDVAGSFLQPLRGSVAAFMAALQVDGKLAQLWNESETKDEKLGQLQLMQYTVEKVVRAVVQLNDAA